MEVPKLYRISAEVERDQKSRFRVFSKSQGRTMRAQLTHMVGQAIVGVELPEVVAPESSSDALDRNYLQLFGKPRPKGADEEGVEPPLPPIPEEADLVDDATKDWRDYIRCWKVGMGNIYEYWIRMGCSNREAQSRTDSDPRMSYNIGDWEVPEVRPEWEVDRRAARGLTR
jgi:hypothetical protein